MKYPEQRQKESKWVPGAGEREKQEVTCLMGMVISLWVDENDLELEVMVAQNCECTECH